MSGSLSYLTSLFSASFGAGDTILDAIYGIGSTASTQDPVQALASAEANQTQDVKVTAAQPTTSHCSSSGRTLRCPNTSSCQLWFISE